MLISPSFVLVKEITSHVPRSNFSEDELNLAAELILQAEGIIQPLILRPIGLDAYEVVDGYFEYYAAVRAKEIDPRRGERIGAFIIEGKNKEVLQQQVEVFRNRKNLATFDRKEKTETITVIENNETETDLKQVIQDLKTSLITKIEYINQKLDQENTSNLFFSTKNSEKFNYENLFNELEKLIEDKVQFSLQEIQNSLNQQLEGIRIEIGKMSSVMTKEPSTKKLDKTPQEKFKQMDKMYNKTELSAIAKKQGIKVPTRMKKDEIILAILESQIE